MARRRNFDPRSSKGFHERVSKLVDTRGLTAREAKLFAVASNIVKGLARNEVGDSIGIDMLIPKPEARARGVVAKVNMEDHVFSEIVGMGIGQGADAIIEGLRAALARSGMWFDLDSATRMTIYHSRREQALWKGGTGFRGLGRCTC